MRAGVLMAMALAAPLATAAAPSPSRFESRYLYTLSALDGRIASGWASLSYDAHNGEVYTVSQGLVRIFNGSGVEIYSFGGDAALGPVLGIVALEDGDLLALSQIDEQWALVRCDFRGEPRGRVVPAPVPAGFRPDAIAYAKGRVYLAAQPQLRLLVLDPSGAVLASHDLAERLGLDERERADSGITGFNVDRDGNVLFTIAPLFKAYVMSPDGAIRSFGRPGGAPGRFNIVNGIAADERGNLYVADTLKGAVIAFDKDFRFLGEFGSTGPRRGLRRPSNIVAGDGKVFVSQAARQGVAVFEVVAQ